VGPAEQRPLQLQKPGCRCEGLANLKRQLGKLGFESLMKGNSPRQATI
jgi:hypothetical protein